MCGSLRDECSKSSGGGSVTLNQQTADRRNSAVEVREGQQTPPSLMSNSGAGKQSSAGKGGVKRSRVSLESASVLSTKSKRSVTPKTFFGELCAQTIAAIYFSYVI